jgi:two-component system OmpR family response regulator
MRCLVVEDDEETAGYIRGRLDEAGYTVVWCDDGAVGMDLATREHWDIVVLDRMLAGDTDGLAILKALKDRDKTIPVLILSALASIDERVTGLRSGCDDYLTKPFAFEELQARIEALIRRSGQRDEPTELRIADLRLDLRTRGAERANKPIALQPREFRLLEYLVRRQGQIVTRTMLLEGVWDYRFDPQTGVIDVQISRLRQKIDRDFSPPLIHTIRGAGYMVAINE